MSITNVFEGPEKMISWNYADHLSRFVMALVIIFQFYFGVLVNFFNQPDQVDVWFGHLGGVAMTLFFIMCIWIFIRPPLSGCIRVKKGCFTYDSGRKAIDIISLISRFLARFKRSSDLLSFDLLSESVIPRMERISWHVSDIQELVFEDNMAEKGRIKFVFHNRPSVIIDDLKSDEIIHLFKALKQLYAEEVRQD